MLTNDTNNDALLFSFATGRQHCTGKRCDRANVQSLCKPNKTKSSNFNNKFSRYQFKSISMCVYARKKKYKEAMKITVEMHGNTFNSGCVLP